MECNIVTHHTTSHYIMEHIASQIKSRAVAKLFKYFSKKISEKYNISTSELFIILNNETDIKIKEKKKCKTCAENNVTRNAIRNSIFCEEHKTHVKPVSFNIQTNRVFKISWNSKTGFVPKSDVETNIIVGKIKNGIYTTEFTDADFKMIKKYKLDFVPGNVPRPKPNSSV